MKANSPGATHKERVVGWGLDENQIAGKCPETRERSTLLTLERGGEVKGVRGLKMGRWLGGGVERDCLNTYSYYDIIHLMVLFD